MQTATTRAPSSRSPTRSNTVSTSATTLSESAPIASRWRALGKSRAFIPYLTAGSPTPAVSRDAVRAVAATTDDGRLKTALSGATGFIYLISRLGVTGARTDAPRDLDAQVQRVRAASASRLPVAVGFGISTPAQAAAAARSADGVVVGSALMDALARDGLSGVQRLTRELAAAVHG